jgi:hypothetical protein
MYKLLDVWNIFVEVTFHFSVSTRKSVDGQNTVKEIWVSLYKTGNRPRKDNMQKNATNHLNPAVKTPAANMLPTETKLAHENVAIPLIPWPEVQPPASLDPNAITAPPRIAVVGDTRCDDA